MFITYNKDTQTVTIDGNHASAPIRTFDDDKTLQLGRAELSESGFDWSNKDIKIVTGKNLTIYDDKDIACLAWLIAQGYLLNFADASIAPRAVLMTCEVLKGVKVANGSRIGVPFIAGGMQRHLTDKIKTACQKAGFNN